MKSSDLPAELGVFLTDNITKYVGGVCTLQSFLILFDEEGSREQERVGCDCLGEQCPLYGGSRFRLFRVHNQPPLGSLWLLDHVLRIASVHYPEPLFIVRCSIPPTFRRRDDVPLSRRHSHNEEMAADLWVTWQAVILQLSFVEKYRPLIVYHGDGQVFSHLKVSARLPPIFPF